MLRIRILLIAAITVMAARAAAPGTDKLPMFFVGNHGQAPAEVRFMAKASWLNAYFLRSEVLFAPASGPVRLRFEGANPSVEPRAERPLSGRANFLMGSEEHWHTGLPTYGVIVYHSLYPGIDMVYGGNGRELKSEFVVAAGVDPSQIRMRYSGAGALRIDAKGRLVIPAGDRELCEEAPTIYQDTAGVRNTVEGRYSLAADGAVGFVLGPYDRTRPLIIDPVLSYSTLLGGASSNAVTALAVDASGSAYVAGLTASYNFPVSNALQSSDAGGNDAFVAKLNASGNGLIYCTYLGGSGDDRAYGIAVDASGDVLVAGSTSSPNFPVHSPLQAKLAGSRNAFVAKLNPAGTGLLYSTYLGGNGSDMAYGIAVDASGNAYVVGDATSGNFPATGFQVTNKGVQNAFVAKLSGSGSQLLYSTYLGGSSIDHGAAIAVDGSGSVYITGSTFSADFPTANAWQPSNAGGQDAFISKLSADGSALLYSTFLGGSAGTVANPEAGLAIQVDGSGNAYVTGVTSSTNFPILNPLQALLLGTTDAFVAKLTATGTLSYSTYLGGCGQDVGTAIAVDGGGDAYVAGYGYSIDLPVTANALQSTNGGAYDAFVAEINPAGNSLLYLSYLGGNGSDAAAAVALDSANNIYVAGWTLSTNFPVVNAYQANNPGNYGAFVAKISFPALPTNVSVAPNSGSGTSQVFSFQFSDSVGANDLTTVSAMFNTTPATASSCTIAYARAQNTLALMTDSGALPPVSIAPGSGSQQNSQCTLNGAASSVVLQGTVLTLNLALTFQSGFSGSKNVYLSGVNPAGSTVWQQLGTWTIPQPVAPPVPPPAPPPPSAPITVVSVTPSTGSGASQTFSLLISDPKGAADVAQVWLEMSSALASTASACYVRYDVALNVLYLYNDAGTAWLGPITPGTSATIQNSQCLLNAAASAVLQAGTNLTISVSLFFSQPFAGSRTIYVSANSATVNSGWQTEGTWTVSANQMNVISATPSSGSGIMQTFSYVIFDQKGTSDLTQVWMDVSPGSATTANVCYTRYVLSPSSLYLLNDGGTVWTGPLTPGSSGTLHNSQCTLNAATSSASASGTNLLVNLGITFSTTFVGVKSLYVDAANATAYTGWQPVGSYTVISPSNPISVVSVTPNSGSGLSQTFRYVISDQRGAADLTQVWMEIASGVSATVNSCYARYDVLPKNLYLLNDANTAWLGPITPGSTATVTNSQCTVSAAGSSVSSSGNNVTLNVSLTFTSAFTGLKYLYVYANDTTMYTGWVPEGSWIP
ncbi:MAG TPA: SBBP repeat-containing protein [Bryobacteraceae bacterium]|nr:SBBP repeat-containing protein [Bryobacteraceae bacterium]